MKLVNPIGYTYIDSIHNPECVIEVYIKEDCTIVREYKCLNYNRCKIYDYKLSEYLDRYKGHSIRKKIIETIY